MKSMLASMQPQFLWVQGTGTVTRARGCRSHGRPPVRLGRHKRPRETLTGRAGRAERAARPFGAPLGLLGQVPWLRGRGPRRRGRSRTASHIRDEDPCSWEQKWEPASAASESGLSGWARWAVGRQQWTVWTVFQCPRSMLTSEASSPPPNASLSVPRCCLPGVQSADDLSLRAGSSVAPTSW
jgi:hypothetical protein